jgi:Zn-dependent protease
LGDSTARFMGRLSLNPIVHFDPLGGILLAITFIGSQGTFGCGWAKPTPVNPRNLEGGRWGEAIVAAAGPLSNLVLATAAAIPLRYILSNPTLIDQIPTLALQVLYLFVVINLVLMIFNLFPIPPLDGSTVLFAFMPPQISWRWRPILEQYGFILLFIIFFVLPTFGMPIGTRIVGSVIDVFLGFLLGR